MLFYQCSIGLMFIVAVPDTAVPTNSYSWPSSQCNASSRFAADGSELLVLIILINSQDKTQVFV